MAVTLTMELGPATAQQVANVSVSCEIRAAWARMADTGIEYVFIASTYEPGGPLTVFNASDPGNVACNPPGLNSTDAIITSFFNNDAQTSSSSGTRSTSANSGSGVRRRLRRFTASAGTANTALTVSRRRLDLALHSNDYQTSEITQTTTSISINILSGSRSVEMAASLRAFTPAQVSASLASVKEALSNATGVSLDNITATLTVGSVEIVNLVYSRSVWGIFLDFLLKNIRSVIAGSIAIIIVAVFVSWAKIYEKRRLVALAGLLESRAKKVRSELSNNLRRRLLRARMRGKLRDLVLLYRASCGDMAAAGHLLLHRLRLDRMETAQFEMEFVNNTSQNLDEARSLIEKEDANAARVTVAAAAATEAASVLEEEPHSQHVFETPSLEPEPFCMSRPTTPRTIVLVSPVLVVPVMAYATTPTPANVSSATPAAAPPPQLLLVLLQC